MGYSEMKGKTLVISGGTRGIGKAIVYDFAKQGVNIAFTYNSNEELAQEQVKDFAIRKKMDFEVAKRWLSPNLAE